MFYLAIVGRPNVGKSTLFNKIMGGRPAIVDDTPGVTRDRNIGFTSRDGRKFCVMDTGGFEQESRDDIVAQTKEQALLAVEEADEIYFVVDGRTGLSPAEEELAKLLRKSGKPVKLLVNKIDTPAMADGLQEYFRLGFGGPVPVSAEHSLGIEDLLAQTVAAYPQDVEEEPGPGQVVRVAVVGKPNVGKSSLVNKLLGQERMIVSPVAGTTRDAVDSRITLADGRSYILVDTAGIRRKSKVSLKLEKYAVIMAMKAVERADVVLLLAGADEGVFTQEAKIAGMVEEAGKGLILVVNKWDLLEKETNTAKLFEENARQKLKFAKRAPMIFISSITGQRVDKIWGLVDRVMDQVNRRIGSGELNSIMRKIIDKNPPPSSSKGKSVKIYYVTQASVAPPTFVVMTNAPDAIHFSYRRYLENQLRETTGMDMAPMRFIYRLPSGRRTSVDDRTAAGGRPAKK
ncbi:MAG: ribosome biogenesis GTPase Der [Nitrospinota bacterium]|nr:ribosome biogenesis GTPase Der [Nitrospinota bacterium]